MTREGGVVVANPGSVPEMGHMASGFARADTLRAYVTPIATLDAGGPFVRALPRPVGGRLAALLRRRSLPAAVPPPTVRRAATAAEAAFVATQRLRALSRLKQPALDHRNRVFDAALSRTLRPGDAAVIATYTAAIETLKHARRLGVPSFLEYPIGHHRYAEALLAEEARLVPSYAPTLQYHRLPARQIAQMEEEIALADKVFVLSSFQQRSFVESGVDPSKLIVTPLGVDIDMFRPGPRADDGVFRVIFVGQITQRKGISYLVDAFRRAAIPKSELVLLGNVVGTDAPWRNTPGVRHLPHVARHQLPAFYERADVFVAPSLVEGFLLTALEAMASGLPVIVSDNTFGRDVVTDGVDGYVVPIRDSEAIAERLRFLYEHPSERVAMGAAALRRAQAFSWESYGDRVVQAVLPAPAAEAVAA